MKEICLVTGGLLPVPAIKGGAIEQLIEILINNNENNPLYKFTIITCKCYNKIRRQYKYTQFIEINTPPRFINSLLWKLRILIKKLTRLDFYRLIPYNLNAERWLLKNGNSFDFIICEGCEINIIRKISKIIGKEKFIYHIHTETFSNNIIEKTIGHFIAVSEYIKNSFLKSTKQKNISINVLYNCISLPRFSKDISEAEKNTIRKKFNFRKDDFIIIFCGRIIPVKGVKELAEAVISINNPHIKLLIVGSSNFQGAHVTPYQHNLKNLAKQNPHKIIFTGYIDNCDLYKYHKISNLAILPFLWEEAFSLSLLEFMASGTPTIATFSGGMPEVGTNKTTIYIQKDKYMSKILKEKIIELYNNPEKLFDMKEQSRIRAEKFDSNNYLHNFDSIINKISNNQ